MRSHSLLEEDQCPVPLELLGRLLVSSPIVVDEEIASMPVARRVSLALFCYSRCHLRDLALRIAATCDQSSLVSAAGHAGAVLRSQALAGMPEAQSPAQGRRRITLARSAA
jgi:hypothetical protein